MTSCNLAARRRARGRGAARLAAALALALVGCGESTRQGGLSVAMGGDPLAQPKARKPQTPRRSAGLAPKEREIAWLWPGPETLAAGAVRTTQATSGSKAVEVVEVRRFVRGKWTQLVQDLTRTDAAEPERRRLLGLGDVVYEIGAAKCRAWRTARAAEQVALRGPDGERGLRPYPAEWRELRHGPLGRFHGPFRARLLAEDDVVEGHRADRYGVSLGASDGGDSGTAEVWIERDSGAIVATRGEVLPGDGAEGAGAFSFVSVRLDEDVGDEPELDDECRRAEILP